MNSRRTGLVFGMVLALGAALAAPAAAQDVKREITQISGDLYRFQNNFHYSVFLVTGEGIIATDPINAEAAGWLKAELAAGRPEDAQSGGAGVGPQRSDVRVTDLDTEAPADQCSTGEQKALLIAIVLADARLRAAERGTAPLLLLDEVAAHLDADRREALFAEICDLGAQTWLTGTDAALFEGLAGEAQFVAVEDAAVRLLS